MRPMEEREQALQLYLKEHLGAKVIAKKTGVPLDTVKTWIRRYRMANSLSLGNYPKPLSKEKSSDKISGKPEKDYEKRIKQLEMEVELLRDFLSEQERRSIKK